MSLLAKWCMPVLAKNYCLHKLCGGMIPPLLWVFYLFLIFNWGQQLRLGLRLTNNKLNDAMAISDL